MAGTTITSGIYYGITIGSGVYSSPLYITSNGAVFPGGTDGATAVYAPPSPAIVSLTNAGRIGGGTGTFGDFGGFDGGDASDGGIGGYGVNLRGPASVTNSGFIVGGDGGQGGPGGYGVGYPALSFQSSPGPGGKGGAGGLGNAGIILAASGTIANSGTIVGGYGGAGGAGGRGGNTGNTILYQIKYGGLYTPGQAGVPGADGADGSDGGVGGSGVAVLAGLVTNSGQILGGAGGAGGNGGAGSTGATGLDGGISYVPLATGTTGGDGGDGGDGADGGNGLIGGIGVDLSASTSLTNTGTIVGGAGGNGGDGGAGGGGGGGGYGGTAGPGGTGPGTGGAAGGNGGDGGDGGNGGNAGNGGVGGVGVNVATSASLTNYGTIVGGAGGSGGSGGDYGGFGAYGHGGRPWQGALFGTLTPYYGPFGADGSFGSDGSYGSDGADAVGGPGVYIDGGTVTNFGTIEGGAGAAMGDAVLFGPSGGTLAIGAGSVLIGNVVGNGGGADVVELVTSSGSGTIDLGDGSSGLSSINFTPGQQLTLEGGLSALASGTPITGFAAGDTIILDGFVVTENTDSYVPGTGLELHSASGDATLNITGAFTTADFLVSDPPGDTTITLTDGMPCYCRGTLILTDRGEIVVEDLQIGARLITRSGAARPIVWIGRRSYAGRFAAGNPDAMPVLVRQGALADGVPRRDLFVSPLHAMYIDDVLIPAAALVNGISIIQMEAIDRVDYFHLELDTHDVIVAEGAYSETFVDDGSRGMFANAREYSALYPGKARRPALFCAPRVEDGEALEAVRQALLKRCLPVRSELAEQGLLRGQVDQVDRERIVGWAQDSACPDEPVRLRILDNGVTIGDVVADRYRPDLERAGIGLGRCSFELVVPGGLSPSGRHMIQVMRASDGQDLECSPWALDAMPMQAVQSSGIVCPGLLDNATRDTIEGWAHDDDHPGTPVALQVLDNGLPIARLLANRYRSDLREAGIGTGRHGFLFDIPGGLSPLSNHVISVRRERDGADVAGSPIVIVAADSFDSALETSVARAIDSLASESDQRRVLSFMAAQADRLRQHHADHQGQRAERQAYRRALRGTGQTAAGTDPGRRALVIDLRFPVAGRDAGSQAILSHMRALQCLGYAVSFIAADEITGSSQALLSDGITICGAPFHASVEDVLRRHTDTFDVVYLHRVAIASRYLNLVRDHCPGARILYSVADLHHVRLARQAALEDRPDLLAESERLRFAEYSAAWSADAVVTHSADEAAVLSRVVSPAKIHCVAWAIPTRPTVVPFAERCGVAFIGGYQHTPNVDAAYWLAEVVMPLVWRINPTIGCVLVGSDMPEAVRRLAAPNIMPIGHVADLADGVFDRVRLTVAPLRYGAGLKGKILESLAAGVPCVMSEVAAEGLALPPFLRELVGTDAATLAASICRMHDEETANRTASAAGMALISQTFTADAILADLRLAIAGPRQPASRSVASVSIEDGKAALLTGTGD
jgi:hypothetical protein